MSGFEPRTSCVGSDRYVHLSNVTIIGYCTVPIKTINYEISYDFLSKTFDKYAQISGVILTWQIGNVFSTIPDLYFA